MGFQSMFESGRVTRTRLARVFRFHPGTRFPRFSMSFFELISLLLLLAIGWFWLDSIRARDIAIQAARETCDADEVQFLDETVTGQRVRLTRDDQGKLRLWRIYRFEFSDTGNNRRVGTIMLIGDRVELINTGPRLVH